MDVNCVSCGKLIATLVMLPPCFELREDVMCSVCQCTWDYMADVAWELAKENYYNELAKEFLND